MAVIPENGRLCAAFLSSLRWREIQGKTLHILGVNPWHGLLGAAFLACVCDSFRARDTLSVKPIRAASRESETQMHDFPLVSLESIKQNLKKNTPMCTVQVCSCCPQGWIWTQQDVPRSPLLGYAQWSRSAACGVFFSFGKQKWNAGQMHLSGCLSFGRQICSGAFVHLSGCSHHLAGKHACCKGARERVFLPFCCPVCAAFEWAGKSCCS